MRHYHIPVFVPHRGCPFDCVFCNQRHIAGQTQDVTPQEAEQTVKTYLSSFREKERIVEIAFFGGSFTGIPAKEQTAFLEMAYRYKKAGLVDGIRLSTRPDYISKEILDRLLQYGVTVIELGVQSMCDDVLSASGRGHTAQDVRQAAKMIRKYPFSLGLQVMTGLPGDTKEKSLETVGQIIELKPNFVRIYPTLVVADTALAELYQNGHYEPMDVESAVKLCKEMKVRFREAHIPVIRISLQTTEEICPGGSVIAGPYHSAFAELVDGMILLDELRRQTKGIRDSEVVVRVHPSDVSRVVGQRRCNAAVLKEENNITLRIKQDRELTPFSEGGRPVVEGIQGK